jgi:hypothetical protein
MSRSFAAATGAPKQASQVVSRSYRVVDASWQEASAERFACGPKRKVSNRLAGYDSHRVHGRATRQLLAIGERQDIAFENCEISAGSLGPKSTLVDQLSNSRFR